jgi:hypothetical protein
MRSTSSSVGRQQLCFFLLVLMVRIMSCNCREASWRPFFLVEYSDEDDKDHADGGGRDGNADNDNGRILRDAGVSALLGEVRQPRESNSREDDDWSMRARDRIVFLPIVG